ncbi:helix-turn-helix transcriptional regulator [uncultured Litoreibacter sp.]|uniref:helix-turn-helix transcriptional regulator n=1 Tax=uncultured Litoreibacter sp. TaxID=1392394 RepID=UPI002628C5C1|nr:helix-turn-helix transcriptional regulator [uncultured Litoreibacter sp.]
MHQSTKSLWGLFILQAACAAFFAFDAVSDFLGWEAKSPLRDMDVYEYVFAAVLVVSLAITAREIVKMQRRQKRLKQQVDVASGAFAELLERQFEEWQLTSSEAEVAMLAIKGLSIADMARLRDTKEGTIKAQCAAVYRKAGVTGRLQLLSLFIEELMAETLIPAPRDV